MKDSHSVIKIREIVLKKVARFYKNGKVLNFSHLKFTMLNVEESLQRIGQLLIHENRLSYTSALEYQGAALANKQTLIQYLVANNLFSSQYLALILAKHCGTPLIDLDCFNFDAIPTTLVNEKVIRSHNMVPLFKRGHHLFIATEDPSQQASLKEIQFYTGLNTSAVVVESTKLTRLIDNLFPAKLTDYPGNPADLEKVDTNTKRDQQEAESISSEEAPLVKFTNHLFMEAIKKGASDIHLEPYENQYRVRYRHDGLLMEVTTIPVNLANRVTARIKVMSNLNLSERRLPQDGRFKIKLSDTTSIDFRVSTCPVVGGEKMVLRIFDPSSIQLSIETLGLNPPQKKHLLTTIKKPQGMILVTGPTGSGKTVSLYSVLNLLNTKEKNILTVEDPVEINVPGINQVTINPKIGLTFSNILRSFLRQDPDIIMVGEIRDLETAEIAVKAAQTGHLVLSTLHTNSAAETLTRLVNMGIPSFNIASSITLLVAQRLARRLCEHCKVLRNDITSCSLIKLGFSKEETETIPLYKAFGCNRCTKGYHGRIGLFEMMPMSKTIGQLIMSGHNSLDIFHQAQTEGMMSIYQSGLEKIKQGLTSIEEIHRVVIDE